ncbi:hypothetical protein [Paenibacillus harenae]|uniref:Uncharacterized protein n=1 Tax=Paenibacillus harenae TaxID=306543 RepID=A0ABT9U8T3_PAEHA|nr:hypothetical protein [Paenibacillus harenae]MDQ0114609.1 hypothetical protein [Paenibacillus harenae]
MKNYMIICFCLIIVIAATSILVLTNHSNDKSIEYKTDIEPLVSRFPNIGEINDSYWAADTYGGDFGPTSYWMKGYIKSSHFVGEFHMDLRNGVLYFDVQK